MDFLLYILLVPPFIAVWMAFWGGLLFIIITPILRLTGKRLPDNDSLFDKYALIVFYEASILNSSTYGSTWKYLQELAGWIFIFAFGSYGLFYLADELL